MLLRGGAPRRSALALELQVFVDRLRDVLSLGPLYRRPKKTARVWFDHPFGRTDGRVQRTSRGC